jgi:hypothetical protein
MYCLLSDDLKLTIAYALFFDSTVLHHVFDVGFADCSGPY